MTAKITISVSDNLKRLITKYNERHPFEPLIISHLAQKAIFEKIKTEDPELLNPELLTIKRSKPSKENPKQHTLQIVCAECGKTVTAQRSTKKFCSGKCKTAYERKSKKE